MRDHLAAKRHCAPKGAEIEVLAKLYKHLAPTERNLGKPITTPDHYPMKLRAAIAEFETDIQIWRVGRRFSATIGDRHYELDLHESNAGGYLLIYDGHVFDCRIEGRPESGKSVDVIVGKTHYSVTLTDSKRLRGATSAAAHGDAAARIIAPMPGKVVRVLVEVGVQVEAGAGIVTVEAMKMQNEMKSPKAGTVVAVNVQADATVNAGDVLAIIE